ncbi:MAG: hypothetical protein NTV97_34445 [Alphaproteobacteria bacterium]|nr:hypothetical protein [Alphaproteobacteria bacterium]
MRPLISLAIALLIGLGIVALASDVLKQWSLAHYATQTDNYTPPSEARRP